MGERLVEWWRDFSCRMGWHKKPAAITFDGASLGGRCPRCGVRVLQDSQGKWFGIGR